MIRKLPIAPLSYIRYADAYTMQNEPISSVDLIRRAALAIAAKLMESVAATSPLYFFCGKGNNGADGLYSALLLSPFYPVRIFVEAQPEKASEEYLYFLNLLQSNNITIEFYSDFLSLDYIDPKVCFVDAILGSGLNGVPREPYASLIHSMNNLPNKIYSIDIASGLSPDCYSPDILAVKAHKTYSFQFPKMAFMWPEYEQFVGDFEILDIGLHPDIMNPLDVQIYLIEEVNPIPLHKFDHKGKRGKTLLIAGSDLLPGAALLSIGGALRSGVGYVEAIVPQSIKNAALQSYPSVILRSMHKLDDERYDSVMCGPGLGTDFEAKSRLLLALNMKSKCLILDADALNLIHADPGLMHLLPDNTVITPHIGEFDRLTHKHENHSARLETLKNVAMQHKLFVLLKGAHSCLACPDGNLFFNNSGNAGLARAGSGDVLSGLMAGLCAGDLPFQDAIIQAVFMHGRMAENALKYISMQEMNASDLIR